MLRMDDRLNVIEEANLSVAWARAIKMVTSRGTKELAPLVLSVTAFDNGVPSEHPRVREAIDKLLAIEKKQSVHTVANTIFPVAYWNPKRSRADFFARYATTKARIKSASKLNKLGMYFDRLVSGGPPGAENQLDFLISAKRAGVRRSVFQAAVFNPQIDHSRAPRRGFPCLQHVQFAPAADGLHVNAFYATQYLIERAYGNYLGLCRLGAFVAHELGVPLARMTCFVGLAQLDLVKKRLGPILAAIETAIPAENDDDEEEGR
jgi:hypothetical protein